VKTVQTLISLARAKVHTDEELAGLLGTSQPALSEMKNGKRAVSPETVATMCDIAGIHGQEALEWLAASVIQNPKNSARTEVFRRVFFACLIGGVAMSTLFSSQSAEASQTAGQLELQQSVYYVNRFKHWLRGLLAALSDLSAPWRRPILGA